MARRKPADTVHLRLRFSEKLRRRIEAAAVKNQQSMNLEIVERLERSFGQEDTAATIDATANTAASAAANLISVQLIKEFNLQFGALFSHRLGDFLSAKPEELPAFIEDLKARQESVERLRREREGKSTDELISEHNRRAVAREAARTGKSPDEIQLEHLRERIAWLEEWLEESRQEAADITKKGETK
jgi:hypothetical protein